MDKFDLLNQQTFNYNNGISRNISPTTGCNRIKASDLLANYNNYTYKKNNGQYKDNLYR